MAVIGEFLNSELSYLQTLQTKLQTDDEDALTGTGQSYSIGGRSFTGVNAKQISDDLAEVNYAIQVKSGVVATRTYANCSEDP